MTRDEITKFLKDHEQYRQRTIVIVDYGNVDKWGRSLGWKVGTPQLAKFVKNFSIGDPLLRRFYYGSDYGPSESSALLTPWSNAILTLARNNGFFVVTKRVKYIHSGDSAGYEVKCDLDVEMAVDLIQEREHYDTIFVFSGDGDLVRALEYLKKQYGKKSIVMGARGHIGREIIDAKKAGIISSVLYADDFNYRLNLERFTRR